MRSIPPTLRERYEELSDAAISDAMQAGPTGYSADAWLVIQEEAAKRRITSDQSPSRHTGTPPTLAPAATPAGFPLRLGPSQPRWLSALLIVFGLSFAVVQAAHILAFYSVITLPDELGHRVGSLSNGLTALSLFYFARRGPYSRVAAPLFWLALVVMATALWFRFGPSHAS